MSRNQETEETFKTFEGTPELKHKKKTLKAEKKKAEEKKRFQYVFYTEIDGKLLRCIVKPNGLYKQYVGRVKMIQDYAAMKTKYKRDGQWINEHDIDEKTSEICQKLAEEYQQYTGG